MDTENPSTNQWGFISPAVLLPAATSAHKHTPHAWNTLVAKPPDVHSWAGARGALPPK